MMNVEINHAAVEEASKRLARITLSSPGMRRALKKAIGKVLRDTRNKVAKDVRQGIGSDPRRAYQAVRRSLYRKILGGNISILSGRSAGNGRDFSPVRKIDTHPHQRGGNRIQRSDRTERLNSYYGKDRAFVLRFLNSGTDSRTTRFGNRGSIHARRVFAISAAYQMDKAVRDVNELIEEVLAEEFDNDKK